MLLKEIAKEHNVDWDSTSFESLLIKPPDDLLDGSTKFKSANDVPSLRRPNEDLPSISMEAISKESAAQLLSPMNNHHPSTAAQDSEPKPYIHQPRIPPPSPVTPSEASRQMSERFTPQATQSQTQKPAGNDSPHHASSGPMSMGTKYTEGHNQPVQSARDQGSYERTQTPQDLRSGVENKIQEVANSWPTRAEGMGYKDAAEAAEAASVLADRAVAAAQAAAQLANTEYRSLKSTVADERSSKIAQQLSQQVISDDDDDDYIIDDEPDDSDENINKISHHNGQDKMDRNPAVNEFQDQKSFVQPIFDDYQEEVAPPPRKPVIQGSFDAKTWCMNDDEEYPRNESNHSYDSGYYDDREDAYGRRLKLDKEPPHVSSSHMRELRGSYSHRSDEHENEVHHVLQFEDIFIEGGTSSRGPSKTMLKSDDTGQSESHPSYDSSGSDDADTNEATHWLAAGKSNPNILEDSNYSRELEDRAKQLEDQDAYMPQIKTGTAGKGANASSAEKKPPPINIFTNSDSHHYKSDGQYSSSPLGDDLQVRPTRYTEAEHLSDNYERSSSQWSHRVDDEHPLSPPVEISHQRRTYSPSLDGRGEHKPLDAFVAPTFQDELKDRIAFSLSNESNSPQKDLSPMKPTLREFWECETKRDFGELGFITGRTKLGSSNAGMPSVHDVNSDLDEYIDSDIKAPNLNSRGMEEESEYGHNNRMGENGSYHGESTSGKAPSGSHKLQTGKLNWQSRKSKHESESHVHSIAGKPALSEEGDSTDLDGYTSLEDSEYYIPKSKMSTAVPRTPTRYGKDSKLLRHYGILDGNDSPSRRPSEGQRSPEPLKDEESKGTHHSQELSSLHSKLHLDKQQKSLSPSNSGSNSPILSLKTYPGSSIPGKPLKFISRSGYENPSTSIEPSEIHFSKIDKQSKFTTNQPDFGTASMYEGLQSKRSSKVDDAKSNLINSKASSDSWGQQKVSVKSHQKTESAPGEQLPKPPQKFKIIKPPEIDDIESMLRQKR
jgi:hypothetical protein